MPISMRGEEDGGDEQDVMGLSFKVTRGRSGEMVKIQRKCVVKLSEVYMIEHSVRLVDVGMIEDDELPLLQQLRRDASQSPCRSWLLEEDDIDSYR
ncbi:hypothetical protein Tdes44962_MAKER01901 [Teratosphaeria destructans]|uniref:Uncharacterized protein n=1 Tax=Teratosphaeria destructans TaxID=418781 RepID=A0A9W7SW23_9PEZI|nr:hypothetical protein Tdes44962_MAKER01901 [Teratosphaeria destructans]